MEGRKRVLLVLFVPSADRDGQPVAEQVAQDGVRARHDIGRDGHARRDMEIRDTSRGLTMSRYDTIAAIPSSLSHGTMTARGCAGVTTPPLVCTTIC